MKPRPTGHVRTSALGTDLVITRTFHAPIEDVWQSVTAAESTARWIGPWEGEPGPGKTIRLQMAFEKGAPWCPVTIDVCDPPNHLSISTKDEHGQWRLELSLAVHADTTVLTFVQHLSDPASAGEVGPGWEYYLDMLVASRNGQPIPDFAEYYPAQRDYYLDQARTANV
ncbi:SRPBCC family protein [Pendulispora albinea]|uniref:SRPBCC family protein n=1 Tax=Pendulispora albinea TaxID=2741071 RepID=A0ABZ2M781_9BACT